MFCDRNLTVTAVAERYAYGQSRKSSRARIARQNVAAKRERNARAQAVFFAADDHAGLVARGRGLLEREPADPVVTVNVGRALAVLDKAETSWKRPGHVVVWINTGDAVLLGNVLRRLNGFVLGLDRLDEIAGRVPPAGTAIECLTPELIAAIEALDAAGEARAAAILRTAMLASTTCRLHVAPGDAGWLADVLRTVGAPGRLVAALAPIAAAAEGSAA
ncbi:hypothetical protein [Methylobacterium thuringiense]|uniref:Uncharacterized protein n=1 Tax=Methylobacterium thuringiense TaxID=1003091 RepID=A0ABQ4TKH7_9HYPH|nr:hypothetical protein [Methylobacterium thuringiense]GJE54540.1 hypothetical protein EKPJFOCH_1018 [Methylobacterium thuringiense]